MNRTTGSADVLYKRTASELQESGRTIDRPAETALIATKLALPEAREFAAQCSPRARRFVSFEAANRERGVAGVYVDGTGLIRRKIIQEATVADEDRAGDREPPPTVGTAIRLSGSDRKSIENRAVGHRCGRGDRLQYLLL